LTSPLVRARQTAEIAAEAMKLKEAPIIAHELTNGTTTATLLHVLKKCQDAKRIVLVGHSPSLPDHVAALIGAKSESALRFGKGAIACVDLEELRLGGGELRWFMGQKLLRLIERS
jgi:phosphohistidine phosphatase